MSIYPVLVAAVVAAVVAALWGAGFAWYGRTDDGPFRTRVSRVRTAGALTMSRTCKVRILIALGAGVVVFLATGWPIGGILTTLLIMTVPFFFGGARIAALRISRLEGLEQWVRHLADTLAVNGMPVQAIQKSALTAPASIRGEVGRLASRLATPRLDRNEVLRDFADEIDDALGDIVALALQRAVNAGGGQRVPHVLQTLAEAVAAEVRARRAVEKGRAGPRKETQSIVVVLGVGVAAVVLFTNYAQLYATPTGQIVLVLLSAVVLFALAMMRRLSIGGQPPRILTERHTGPGEDA